MPKYVGVILSLCLTFLLIGCAQQNEEIVPETMPTEINVEVEPTTAPTYTAEPTQPDPLPTQPPAAPTEEEEQIDWIQSGEAGDYLGLVKTVRIELSHCAYKPGINGSPTFCNDQPYPDHAFTYLVWGKDWSHFDQTCVLVTGEIVEYDGKAQIVVEEEEQIVHFEE